MSSPTNPTNPPPSSGSSPVIVSSPAITAQPFLSRIASFPSTIIKILKKSAKKLVIWFVFTVIVGLMPIAASGVLGNFDHKLKDLFDLFIHGELLIISFALAADAMGDLVNSNKLGDIFGVFLFCFCFALFGFSGLVFAGLSIIGDIIDKQEVGTFSIYMLIATLLVSMACKILTEV